MNPEESAIREVIATWLRASAEGDQAKVLSLMTEDVVFLVAGRPPFGKAEFAAAQEGLAGHRIEANSEVREVRVSGDLAYCWTDLKISMTPANGGPAVRRSGNTLTIFELQSDGKWLLSRDANLLTLVS